MIRTILMTGLFAMLGLFALGMVFKIFGGLLGVAFWLIGMAIKVAIVGAVAYLAIRVVSPGTARRLRERWSETRMTTY
ncbi:MAG: hypothetical protein ACR2GJ_07335 [Gemmatimonadaceae bacterium]